jgi:spore coat protein H
MLVSSPMRRLLVLFALTACGNDSASDTPDAAPPPPDAYVDLSGPVFEPSHIVDISLTLPAADWDTLRNQTRSFGSVIEGDCLSHPAPSPFSKFTASLTIDGTTFSQVSIHKKGFFGSLDSTKPSLKVDLDDIVAGTEYLGLEKLTLNNAHQDPTIIHQCLAYETFAKAGIIVPRCNYAHVHVNGKDLGIYVNVETIDHHLTKKRYPDGTGQLYEGTLSDFRSDWLGTFDPKGGGDHSDLLPIAQVLENSPDATLVADLSPYVDVDRYLTFWAMEIITNHWDGYANDHNNFYIYHDPITGKLDFIPWGVDATFQPGVTFNGIGATNGPIAVAAAGILPYRLFAIPEMKQKFLDRQRTLLTTIWKESDLLAEVDRMQNLIAPIEDAYEGTAWHAQVDTIRQFVNGRRAQLTAALDAGPTWPSPLQGYPCLAIRAQVTGTFDTTWGTIGAADPFTTGTGTLQLTINGVTTTLTPVGAKSGLDPNPPAGQAANAVVQIFGQRASDGHIIVVQVGTPPPIFFPRTGNLGFFDGIGGVFDFNPATNSGEVVGFMLGGFTLQNAATTNGARVRGSFTANADQPGTPP